VHAVKYVTDKNLAYSDKRSRTVSVWCVIPILVVFACCQVVKGSGADLCQVHC